MENTIDLQTKIALIKKQNCFSSLSDIEMTELSELFIEKHFKPGGIIVTQGDSVDSVYLIVSGTAEVRYVTVKPNGELEEKSVAKLGPEHAIGLNETGFYSLSGMRTATVIALTDMVLLRLSVPAFHGFALSHARVSAIMRKFYASNSATS